MRGCLSAGRRVDVLGAAAASAAPGTTAEHLHASLRCRAASNDQQRYVVTQAFLHEKGSSTATTGLVNEFLEQYGRNDLIHEYFSERRFRSWEARHAWVEPDLRPLDFLQ